MKERARADSQVDEVLPVVQTGNTVPTLTVKISKPLRARLAAAAKRLRTTQSELVRQAIEDHLREPIPAGESLYDQVKDLIEGLPPPDDKSPTDLARNKKWLEGLGLDNAQLRALHRARRRR